MKNSARHSITMLALACSLEAQAPIIKRTEHFEVHCHIENARAAKEAAAAVESTWGLAARIYDLKRVKLKKRLKVYLYATVDDYNAADAKLTNGRFKKNQAFAHFASKSAHVALQPPIPTDEIGRRGLPAQTLRLLTHEAAHIVRYSYASNYESHPRWFADGAASWIDHRMLEESGYCPEFDQDPFVGRSVRTIQRLIREKRLPSIDDFLSDHSLDGKAGTLGFYEKYNASWLLFRFLMEEEGARVQKVATKLRQLGGGTKFAERLRKAVVSIFGKSRYRKLDKRFHTYVNGLKPIWMESLRTLETHKKPWRQMAFPDVAAIAFRTKPIGKTDYSIAGRVQIERSGKNQMNVLLGHSDKGFVSVTIRAGVGVNVFHRDSVNDRWHNLFFHAISELPFGEEIPFAIKVKGKQVNLTIADKNLGSVRVKGQPLDGAWGLGAQAGSIGTWHDLQAPGLDER